MARKNTPRERCIACGKSPCECKDIERVPLPPFTHVFTGEEPEPDENGEMPVPIYFTVEDAS